MSVSQVEFTKFIERWVEDEPYFKVLRMQVCRIIIEESKKLPFKDPLVSYVCVALKGDYLERPELKIEDYPFIRFIYNENVFYAVIIRAYLVKQGRWNKKLDKKHNLIDDHNHYVHCLHLEDHITDSMADIALSKFISQDLEWAAFTYHYEQFFMPLHLPKDHSTDLYQVKDIMILVTCYLICVSEAARIGGDHESIKWDWRAVHLRYLNLTDLSENMDKAFEEEMLNLFNWKLHDYARDRYSFLLDLYPVVGLALSMQTDLSYLDLDTLGIRPDIDFTLSSLEIPQDDALITPLDFQLPYVTDRLLAFKLMLDDMVSNLFDESCREKITLILRHGPFMKLIYSLAGNALSQEMADIIPIDDDSGEKVDYRKGPEIQQCDPYAHLLIGMINYIEREVEEDSTSPQSFVDFRPKLIIQREFRKH